MRKLFAFASAVAALVIGGPAAWAVGPSFDCAAVQKPDAQIVCSSPDLSRAELSLMQAYYALRWQVGPGGWPLLRQEQLNFQNQTPQQCGLPRNGPLPSDTGDMATCLQHAYEHQRETWVSRLTGPGAEEAARRIEIHVALQKALQLSGFLPSTEVIDGVYGTTTRTAISAWQHANGRPETGFLSPADATTLLSGQGPPAASGAPSPAANLPPIMPPTTQAGHASMPSLDLGTQTGGGAADPGWLEDILAQYRHSMGSGGLVTGLGMVLVVLGCLALFRAPRQGGTGGRSANVRADGRYNYATARQRVLPGSRLLVWGALIALSGVCLTYGPKTVYQTVEQAVARLLA
jgi:hypothetical protein